MYGNGEYPEVGNLVTVSKLTSARGQTLNGRYGEVISLSQDTGRVGVLVYSAPSTDGSSQISVTQCPPGTEAEEIALKPENLEKRISTCEVFHAFLAHSGMMDAQKRDFRSAIARFGRVIALHPDDYATMATLRHRLQYDLATSLFDSQPMEALTVARSIDTSTDTSSQGHPMTDSGAPNEALELKLELFELIGGHCRKGFQTADKMALEIDTMRSALELQPQNGRYLWNLAGVLCRSGEVSSEAVSLYEQAVQHSGSLRDSDKERLKRDYEVARQQLAARTLTGDANTHLVGNVTVDGQECGVFMHGKPGVDFAVQSET
eukprot:CAMPEP_0197868128 /NCGR_PEP_ID=MMETSP1438-20131217/45123_1 /TAXON_ID=1461541 /ORGANISM="Pterosperma sp., Strain CCMP1384" /LENGTH=319 /DNA_ID=CAMNT_0043486819 /DNA_START=419 /DNA_END=1378 /DNA_ORIENTATION=-